MQLSQEKTPRISMTWPQLRRNEFTLRGRPVRLEPQTMKVFAVLYMNLGRVVRVEDLIEGVWPNPELEPDYSTNVIYQKIHNLRRHLSEELEHLWGRGYILAHPSKWKGDPK